jgi:hypothetical protein
LGSAATVVSEAVLNADDDPERVSKKKETATNLAVAYHRFVKTTPKPRATKKSSGELVGPPPPPPLLLGGSVVAKGLSVAIVLDMVGCNNSTVP